MLLSHMTRGSNAVSIGMLSALPVLGLPALARSSGLEAADPPQATIWYLGHCGYAVQIANRVLIFDYIELEETVPAVKGLERGFIDATQLKDLNVTVFVTHAHVDHFDAVILEWQEEIDSIEYVFGWDAMEGPGYHNLPGPRGELRLDGMEIYTVNSHHSDVPEVAYLVKVDGLTIYHGGDYQGRMGRNAPSNVDDDMAYLNTKADSVDLFFIGAWTGEPYMKAIRALNPRFIFPMHERQHEERYEQFAQDLAGLGVAAPVIRPARRGDRFSYENGTVR